MIESTDPSIDDGAFSPYVNAFAGGEGSERWAAETEAAVTVGLTFSEGDALARTGKGAPIVGSDSL